MEDWQRTWIWRNLGTLNKNTICNSQLLSELTLFLSEDDDDKLEAKKSDGRLEQAKLFYKISVTKSGMYTPLALALFETKQYGAFSVLLRGFMEVSVKNTFNLSELDKALPSMMRYGSHEINKPSLFVKIGDLDVLNEALRNCFEPTEVQISHSWWNSSKYISEKIETFQFSNKRLFSFLELLVSKYNKVLTNLTVQNVTKDFISKWVHACVMDNRFSLINIAVKRGVSERVFESKYLLMLAVYYGDTPTVDLIVSHYIKQTKIPLQDDIYEFRWEKTGHCTNYSILEIAALRGSFPIMQSLLKNVLIELQSELLIHRCVVDTQCLPEDKVNERKRIIELILQKHPTLTQSRTSGGHTALHYPNIHIDLIIYMIDLGVDVHATDVDSRNILHRCLQYLTPEEYDKLIRHLHARGDSKLFLTLDRLQCTPLHRAMQVLEVLDSTLGLFSAAKVDFNTADESCRTPIFTAVICLRSERVLNSLIQAGADIQIRGKFNRTVLHVAAEKGNLTALRYLVSRGCDVNATDEQNSTPLHLALDHSNTKMHEIVEELVKNEANVNALNKLNSTPLYYALKRQKKGEVENRTIELLKKAGAK